MSHRRFEKSVSMDSFIERSTALLAARPDTARVSVRYTHKKVHHSKEATVGSTRPAVAIFKTYDPVSGALYKIRVTKANELSRILSSLGPRYVEITKGSETHKKRGAASLMSGVEPKDVPVAPETPAAPAAAAAPAEKPATKKKQHKKKK